MGISFTLFNCEAPVVDPEIWQGVFTIRIMHGMKSCDHAPFRNPAHFVGGANDLEGEAYQQ